MMEEKLLLHSMFWGTSRETMVVLLHGLYGSAREWHPLGSTWVAMGGGAVGLDLRNHGASPHSVRQRLEGMVGDAVHTLERVLAGGVESLVVVGHSMGGAVAQGLGAAIEGGALGGRALRGVLLLDSRLLGDGLPSELHARHVAWHAALRVAAEHAGEPRGAMLSRLRGAMPEGMAQYLLCNYALDRARGKWRWRLGLAGIEDYLRCGHSAGEGVHIGAPIWLVRGAGSPYTAGVDEGGFERVVEVRGRGNAHYPQHMDRARVLQVLGELAGGDRACVCVGWRRGEIGAAPWGIYAKCYERGGECTD